MKKFKLTPEQKAHINSLNCECKKKDAKKRFRMQNELEFYNYNLTKDLFDYSINVLKGILKATIVLNQEKINQIEVKAEEVIKEEKKYVWIITDSQGKFINALKDGINPEQYAKLNVGNVIFKAELK